MITLRLYTVLPEQDPRSGDLWANRVACSSLADAKRALAQCTELPEDAYRALKELADLDFDPADRCAMAKDGARYDLCSLPDDVCAALGIIVLAGQEAGERVFPMFPELESARVLRTLQALPQTFRFATTLDAYERITRGVEHAIRTQAKADKKKDPESSWLFAAGQYDFAVESPGPAIADRNVPALKDMLPAEWEHEPTLLYRALLAQRDKLPALLHAVPETDLGTVNGVPVTGQLSFAPDALLPICVFPHRAVRFGVHGILHCGGKTTTTNLGDTTRGGLLAVCGYVLHLAKTEEGGTAVCLVTDGSAAPDRALFCITATPDGIHVSDYRAAYEEFAQAVEAHLMFSLKDIEY